MRKVVSLLLLVSFLSLTGCAGSGSSQQLPEPVTAPVVSDPAPPPTTPELAKPRPLPALTVKQDARQLYPAYAYVEGTRKWGYIDPNGRFVIQPIFDRAEEFESDDLAIVRQGAKFGLINKDGLQVVAPEWKQIYPANREMVRVLTKRDSGQTVETAGKVLFSSPLVSGNFGSGLAPYLDGAGRFGYVNRAGEVVIPAQFQSAYEFEEGKALVRVGEGSFAVIDPTGKRLGQIEARWANSLSENLFAFQEKQSGQWGYASVTGQVVIPAKFSLAGAFKDGLAVVNISDSFTDPRKGLINTRGEFVIPANYAALEPLGANLYAAARPTEEFTPDEFRPMALLTRDGKQLTDFIYYNLLRVEQDLISVSDGKETYFLDTQGRPAPSMPSVTGLGTLQLHGTVIGANVDGRISYLQRSGQVIWQSDNTMTLAGGLRVIEHKYRPNKATLVFYPELAGMADAKAQESLNQTLRTAFVGEETGGKESATIGAGFSVQQIKGVVILYKSGNWYGWGAAHGLPSRTYYHIDAQTGTIYTLADLFKQGSNHTARLRELIRQQIATRADRPMDQNPEVKATQPFYIATDGLTIYYHPYEIASYAQGFIEFTIPWSEISDLIDINSPFWKAFH